MKPRSASIPFLAAASATALALFPAIAPGTALTWDGGGADGKWSTPANWTTDVAPAATNDTLTFAGTTNLNAENDLVTSINIGTCITFASGAGSFNLSGNTLTLGSGGGGGITILSQQSANPQTISAPINLSGGNGDRSIVFASGAGSLTLSGNINFNNDWLFPTTTAGTLVLSGTNSGDGKASAAISAGTNFMRAMMRNNIANTNLVLGNDSALGNVGTGNASAGSANFRGLIANQNLFIRTDASRDLSGSTLAINSGWIDFNSTSSLSIGNVINVGGNRDFKVTSSGSLTVSNGIFLSQDQTSRSLYLNMTGAGDLTVNGPIHNTFHSGGITSLGVTDLLGQSSLGSFRKAGTGKLILNGDSATTFGGEIRIEGGTVVLGHPHALGASSSVFTVTRTGDIYTDDTYVLLNSATGIVAGMTVTGDGIPEGTTVVTISAPAVVLSQAPTTTAAAANLTFSIVKSSPTYVGSSPNFGTLDLNGQTIAEPIAKIEGDGAGGSAGALINSNVSTPAAITADLTGVYNFSINGAGEITVPRLIATGARVITKNGSGTFTTNGSSHNNLCAWVINAGTVVLANTSGYGSDRGTTVNGGTLKLEGANPDLINNNQTFAMSGGVFDLNGKSEATASISGSGGIITNSATGAATLYVGGGVGGTSSASFGGVIQSGAGTVSLVKEGSGTQTLTGINTYSGDTTVKAGILAVNGNAIPNAGSLVIDGGKVDPSGSTEVVNQLFFGTTQQASGTWGASGSAADHIDDEHFAGTGVVSVTSAPVVGGYSAWATANAPGQTPSQDHDGDGVQNGIEYFMGESGSSFTAQPPVVSGAITWPKDPAFSGTYTVQTSTNLVQWTDVASTVNGNSVTYTLPGEQDKVFARLVVTPN